jgi:TRAP-type C4-dicarboxylate transport system permease small subunit
VNDEPRPPAGGLPGRLLAPIGVAVVLVMVLSTLLAVLARYYGLTGFEWSYEVAGIAFLWITFLGALMAELRGENAAFEVLKHAMAARPRAALDLLAILLLGIVGVALLASGIAMLQRSAFVPTPLLRWPGFVASAGVPVLGAGLCALSAARLWTCGRPRPGAREHGAP